MEKMKAIIVGGGIISETHIEGYRARDVEIVAIVEPIKEVRERAMERCGTANGFETIEEALALKPDVASLCTPNHLHMPHAIQLLESGVNIIVEKPMARTVEECEKMIDAAEKTGKKLFVCHSQRVNPPHQMLLKVMKQDRLGKPVMVVSTFIGNEYSRMSQPNNWKCDYEHSGGGALIDNGAHMINLLLGAMGPVEYVECIDGKILINYEHKGEDSSVVNLKFKNGAIGSLTATFVARACTFPKDFCGAALRTDIVGELGAVTAGNGEPAFTMVENGGANRLEYASAADIPLNMPISAVAHFVDCLRTGAEPYVTMYDGRDTLAVIEAAYKSAREGKRIYL